MNRTTNCSLLLTCLILFAGCTQVEDLEKSANEPPVMVATQDLPSGTTLKPEHLKPSKRIKTDSLEDFVRPEEQDKAIGRKMIFNTREGHPILWSNFEELKSAETKNDKN